MTIKKTYFYLGLFLMLCHHEVTAQLPEGFVDEIVTDDLVAAVGVTFVDTHLFYLWEQDGRVQVFENEKRRAEPLLDINEEVQGSADHGMLGFVLDPKFKMNGYFYVSYVVDPHHLRFFGTPDYDPNQLDAWNATIGRVTRFQVDTTNYLQMVPGSRKVLIGAEIDNGIPVLAPAHGVGGLDFGTDGTLLIGTGDGTTWVGNHTGGTDYKEFGFDSLGKAIGIISQAHDVGSYRSQLLNSYNGKILRIDPMTGLGIKSNPFFQEEAPEGVQSKIWALGLRSPFRIRVRPGSGSENADDGRPGSIYIGDVGSNQFEELNIASEPGRNFGWPSYEGHLLNAGYTDQEIDHPYIKNPLADQIGCPAKITFEDLLIPPNRVHQYFWPNPCDSTLGFNQATFVHQEPAVSYGNQVNNPQLTYLSGFNEQGGSMPTLISEASTPSGPIFNGISSIAGDFYQGELFPEKYRNVYFHGDFSGWIMSMTYDVHEGDELHQVEPFLANANSVVYVRYNPFDQALYYVVLDYRDRPNLYQLRRIVYSANPRPIAIATLDTTYGYSPLSVSLSAHQSYDPQEEEITTQWVFDEGDTLSFIDSTLVFVVEEERPKNINIKLIVTDESGQQSTDQHTLWLNNTPPHVDIVSIDDEAKYSLEQPWFEVPLAADVTDRESTIEDLGFQWEIKLKHNDHFHVEFVDTQMTTSLTLPALRSTDLDAHSYVINLTVIDTFGLQGYDEVTLLPDLSTSISDQVSKTSITGYPNPTFGYFRIESMDHNREIDLLMTDMYGRRVLVMPRQELPLDLNLHRIRSGFYFLQVFEKGKQVDQLRLVKLD